MLPFISNTHVQQAIFRFVVVDYKKYSLLFMKLGSYRFSQMRPNSFVIPFLTHTLLVIGGMKL